MDYFPPRYISCAPQPHPSRFLDQYVSVSMAPPEFLPSYHPPPPFHLHCDVSKPWKSVPSGDTSSKIRKDKFMVNVDVTHFAPEEIKVKVVDDFVIVEAVHDEKPDEHGFIARSFTRRYAVPEGVDPGLMVSKLSSDGVLTVTAPQKQSADEREVPIILTGPIKQVEDKEEPE